MSKVNEKLSNSKKRLKHLLGDTLGVSIVPIKHAMKRLMLPSLLLLAALLVLVPYTPVQAAKGDADNPFDLRTFPAICGLFSATATTPAIYCSGTTANTVHLGSSYAIDVYYDSIQAGPFATDYTSPRVLAFVILGAGDDSVVWNDFNPTAKRVHVINEDGVMETIDAGTIDGGAGFDTLTLSQIDFTFTGNDEDLLDRNSIDPLEELVSRYKDSGDLPQDFTYDADTTNIAAIADALMAAGSTAKVSDDLEALTTYFVTALRPAAKATLSIRGDTIKNFEKLVITAYTKADGTKLPDSTAKVMLRSGALDLTGGDMSTVASELVIEDGGVFEQSSGTTIMVRDFQVESGGEFTQLAGGSLTVGSITVAGDFTQGGSVNIQAVSGVSGTGVLTLSDGASYTVSSSGTLAATSVTMTGASTLTIGGAVTFTGATSISGDAETNQKIIVTSTSTLSGTFVVDLGEKTAGDDADILEVAIAADDEEVTLSGDYRGVETLQIALPSGGASGWIVTQTGAIGVTGNVLTTLTIGTGGTYILASTGSLTMAAGSTVTLAADATLQLLGTHSGITTIMGGAGSQAVALGEVGDITMINLGAGDDEFTFTNGLNLTNVSIDGGAGDGDVSGIFVPEATAITLSSTSSTTVRFTNFEIFGKSGLGTLIQGSDQSFATLRISSGTWQVVAGRTLEGATSGALAQITMGDGAILEILGTVTAKISVAASGSGSQTIIIGASSASAVGTLTAPATSTTSSSLCSEYSACLGDDDDKLLFDSDAYSATFVMPSVHGGAGTDTVGINVGSGITTTTSMLPSTFGQGFEIFEKSGDGTLEQSADLTLAQTMHITGGTYVVAEGITLTLNGADPTLNLLSDATLSLAGGFVGTIVGGTGSQTLALTDTSVLAEIVTIDLGESSADTDTLEITLAADFELSKAVSNVELVELSGAFVLTQNVDLNLDSLVIGTGSEWIVATGKVLAGSSSASTVAITMEAGTTLRIVGSVTAKISVAASNSGSQTIIIDSSGGVAGTLTAPSTTPSACSDYSVCLGDGNDSLLFTTADGASFVMPSVHGGTGTDSIGIEVKSGTASFSGSSLTSAGMGQGFEAFEKSGAGTLEQTTDVTFTQTIRITEGTYVVTEGKKLTLSGVTLDLQNAATLRLAGSIVGGVAGGTGSQTLELTDTADLTEVTSINLGAGADTLKIDLAGDFELSVAIAGVESIEVSGASGEGHTFTQSVNIMLAASGSLTVKESATYTIASGSSLTLGGTNLLEDNTKLVIAGTLTLNGASAVVAGNGASQEIRLEATGVLTSGITFELAGGKDIFTFTGSTLPTLTIDGGADRDTFSWGVETDTTFASTSFDSLTLSGFEVIEKSGAGTLSQTSNIDLAYDFKISAGDYSIGGFSLDVINLILAGAGTTFNMAGGTLNVDGEIDLSGEDTRITIDGAIYSTDVAGTDPFVRGGDGTQHVRLNNPVFGCKSAGAVVPCTEVNNRQHINLGDGDDTLTLTLSEAYASGNLIFDGGADDDSIDITITGDPSIVLNIKNFEQVGFAGSGTIEFSTGELAASDINFDPETTLISNGGLTIEVEDTFTFSGRLTGDVVRITSGGGQGSPPPAGASGSLASSGTPQPLPRLSSAAPPLSSAGQAPADIEYDKTYTSDETVKDLFITGQEYIGSGTTLTVEESVFITGRLTGNGVLQVGQDQRGQDAASTPTSQPTYAPFINWTATSYESPELVTSNGGNAVWLLAGRLDTAIVSSGGASSGDLFVFSGWIGEGNFRGANGEDEIDSGFTEDFTVTKRLPFVSRDLNTNSDPTADSSGNGLNSAGDYAVRTFIDAGPGNDILQLGKVANRGFQISDGNGDPATVDPSAATDPDADADDQLYWNNGADYLQSDRTSGTFLAYKFLNFEQVLVRASGYTITQEGALTLAGTGTLFQLSNAIKEYILATGATITTANLEVYAPLSQLDVDTVTTITVTGTAEFLFPLNVRIAGSGSTSKLVLITSTGNNTINGSLISDFTSMDLGEYDNFFAGGVTQTGSLNVAKLDLKGRDYTIASAATFTGRIENPDGAKDVTLTLTAGNGVVVTGSVRLGLTATRSNTLEILLSTSNALNPINTATSTFGFLKLAHATGVTESAVDFAMNYKWGSLASNVIIEGLFDTTFNGAVTFGDVTFAGSYNESMKLRFTDNVTIANFKPKSVYVTANATFILGGEGAVTSDAIDFEYSSMNFSAGNDKLMLHSSDLDITLASGAASVVNMGEGDDTYSLYLDAPLTQPADGATARGFLQVDGGGDKNGDSLILRFGDTAVTLTLDGDTGIKTHFTNFEFLTLAGDGDSSADTSPTLSGEWNIGPNSAVTYNVPDPEDNTKSIEKTIADPGNDYKILSIGSEIGLVFTSGGILNINTHGILSLASGAAGITPTTQFSLASGATNGFNLNFASESRLQLSGASRTNNRMYLQLAGGNLRINEGNSDFRIDIRGHNFLPDQDNEGKFDSNYTYTLVFGFKGTGNATGSSGAFAADTTDIGSFLRQLEVDTTPKPTSGNENPPTTSEIRDIDLLTLSNTDLRAVLEILLRVTVYDSLTGVRADMTLGTVTVDLLDSSYATEEDANAAAKTLTLTYSVGDTTENILTTVPTNDPYNSNAPLAHSLLGAMMQDGNVFWHTLADGQKERVMKDILDPAAYVSLTESIASHQVSALERIIDQQQLANQPVGVTPWVMATSRERELEADISDNGYVLDASLAVAGMNLPLSDNTYIGAFLGRSGGNQEGAAKANEATHEYKAMIYGVLAMHKVGNWGLSALFSHAQGDVESHLYRDTFLSGNVTGRSDFDLDVTTFHATSIYRSNTYLWGLSVSPEAGVAWARTERGSQSEVLTLNGESGSYNIASSSNDTLRANAGVQFSNVQGAGSLVLSVGWQELLDEGNASAVAYFSNFDIRSSEITQVSSAMYLKASYSRNLSDNARLEFFVDAENNFDSFSSYEGGLRFSTSY